MKYKETNGSVKKWENEHYFVEEVCHIEDENSTTLDLTGEEVHEYLAALAQPCDQMLLRLYYSFNFVFYIIESDVFLIFPNCIIIFLSFIRCKFDGHRRDCSKLFEVHITDEGQCCSFNMMPEYLIFNEEIVSYSFILFLYILTND